MKRYNKPVERLVATKRGAVERMTDNAKRPSFTDVDRKPRFADNPNYRGPEMDAKKHKISNRDRATLALVSSLYR
jgi:hypothetical protein